MDRTQIFNLMGALKLYGMKAAYDEIMATAVMSAVSKIDGAAFTKLDGRVAFPVSVSRRV